MASLKLADAIAAGANTTEQLADHAGAVPDRVHRLLRTLASVGLFTQAGPRTWALTPAGQTLRSDVPGSLHGLAVMWNEEHYDAFRGLIDAVRRPQPAFDQRFGTDWWSYLGEHPDSAEKFYAAMGLRATLLEQSHALPAAQQLLSQAGVADRVTLTPGDFFEVVPSGGDVYLLSMILHDWADEEAIELLRVVRRAMPAESRLLIVEAVLPAGDTPHFGKLLDLTMMAMLTGRERTEQEFDLLLAAAGFRVERVVQTPSPSSLIEARPV